MSKCPDDDMAAGVIAEKLSQRQQSKFDNMALRGAHEYITELEAERDSLRSQLAECQGSQTAADPTKWGHKAMIHHLRRQLDELKKQESKQ